MPRSIVTTITITDDDPPAVTITVHADGNPLVDGSALAPQDATKLIRTIGQASNDPDVEPGLQQMVTPIVARLRQAVTEGDDRQARRKDALAAWQAAAANPNKPA